MREFFGRVQTVKDCDGSSINMECGYIFDDFYNIEGFSFLLLFFDRFFKIFCNILCIDVAGLHKHVENCMFRKKVFYFYVFSNITINIDIIELRNS